MNIDWNKRYKSIDWSKRYTTIAIVILFVGIFFMCVYCIIYAPEKLESLLNKVLWLSINTLMFCLIIKLIKWQKWF